MREGGEVEWAINTPVALIIFNRPDTTQRVFAEIARVKPRKLFVVADGPRSDHPNDVEKCAISRAIIERVDWDCKVVKGYSDINMGCGWRAASGISWVLEQVEEAIILEDDCVPHPTFFRFCEELLEKYRDDERVMVISGRNHLGQRQTPYSYFFGRLLGCWGWATWRRAWKHYDIQMKLWPELRNTRWLRNILADPRAAQKWRNIFDRTHAGKIDTWDFQWVFACWAQNGFGITANINLVRNIGFGKDATSTRSLNDERANVPSAAINFPLQHPPHMVWDKEADDLRFEQSLRAEQPQTSLYRRLRRKLAAGTPDPIRKQISRLLLQK